MFLTIKEMPVINRTLIVREKANVRDNQNCQGQANCQGQDYYQGHDNCCKNANNLTVRDSLFPGT